MNHAAGGWSQRISPKPAIDSNARKDSVKILIKSHRQRGKTLRGKHPSRLCKLEPFSDNITRCSTLGNTRSETRFCEEERERFGFDSELSQFPSNPVLRGRKGRTPRPKMKVLDYFSPAEDLSYLMARGTKLKLWQTTAL